MPRFFVDAVSGGEALIRGNDARHIAKALRMRVGESLVLCDGKGTDYDGVIRSIETDSVTVAVDGGRPTTSEPTLKVTLYQGLPKSDKMDWIVQKAVEMGVTTIVPVAMSRSIAKLDLDSDKKIVRWQRIANEAAGQSGRGILPVVSPPLSFAEAAARLKHESTIVFYEGGGQPVRTLVHPDMAALSIVIGPEGGIAPEEMDELLAGGATAATLGPRILRCETAPIAALALVMGFSGNAE